MGEHARPEDSGIDGLMNGGRKKWIAQGRELVLPRPAMHSAGHYRAAERI